MKEPRIPGSNVEAILAISCLLINTLTETQGDVVETRFSADIVCGVDQRIDNGCSHLVDGVRNELKCISQCAADKMCNGVTSNLTQCVLHYDCPSLYKSCETMESRVFMSKKCHNGGVWIQHASTCECGGIWVGERCRKYPRTCKELVHRFDTPGTQRIYLDTNNATATPLLVACYFATSNNYHDVSVAFHNTKTNYNMTWAEFRDGIFDEASTDPQWIGLKQLHYLTHNQYNKLSIFININDNGEYLSLWKKYKFKVLGENDDFRILECALNKTGETTRARERGYGFGNCLEDLTNVSFSTWDRDQDASPSENCASEAGSGWWYKDCDNPCNLLGWGPQFWAGRDISERFSIPGFQVENENGSTISVLIVLEFSP